MIGQTVSHYRIIEKLGEGGMGVVYLAEDKHLARRVAIKFLSSTDHHYRARFIREARAVSALNHPNIATVHDYGETESGQPFIVMEFVKGLPLSGLLVDGLTLRRSVEIVSSIADALCEAHDQGIIHRDIKPSNVVISERGQVKVLDFGLVKLLVQPTSGVDLDADTIYSTQTRSDVIVGTPLYLSPEQATGKQIDGRSDLFALGALLYECLTGRSAFSGASVLEIGAQIIHVTPPPPSHLNSSVPRELDRITMKALEKRVDARYQSADELLKDLRAAAVGLSLNGVPVSSKLRSSTTVDRQKATNAFTTLTTSLRRERFSLSAVIGAVLLTALAIWAVVHWWPRNVYQPSAAALTWYLRGTEGLRNGAYYQASKALEQAIAIDQNYALAHARLAQAWSELDYTDRAKDELLSATTLAGNRSSLSPSDVLYLDAISALVRRDFDAAIKAYGDITQISPDDSQVYVDLGYAYENKGNLDKALENYLKTIGLNNQQYATAYLRAGIVYKRKQDMEKAMEMFAKAEQLFRAASNNEGVTEVQLQRGILYRVKGRYDEARAQFQQSLESARVLGNEAQQIGALIELSYLLSTRGSIEESEQFAQEAVKFSQDKHLENLAVAGLIQLGNSFSTRGDYETAEKYYKEAIDFARQNKARRHEAMGLVNLGGLYITKLETDDGLQLVEQALSFFQQGNYPLDLSFCYTQLARGNRRKGNYEAAREALDKKLQIAQQSGSQTAVADCQVEIGAVLFDQEHLPDALDHYSKAHDIYVAAQNQLGAVYSQANRASILWRLGRYEEARESLADVSAAAPKLASSFKQLEPSVKLIDAQISLSQGNLENARARVNEAISLAGASYAEVAIEGKFTLALVQALSGNKEAKSLCADAVKMAGEAGDALLLSRAMLVQAQVDLQIGDAQTAQSVARQVRQRFAQLSQLESEWRALLIVSRASERLGDKEDAALQLKEAKDTLRQLEQHWGVEAFKGYNARPDIQVYTKTWADF
jgi:tetratricopeptide (TPR) repeat protein/predicted Ser/Thr protein kinase